VATIEELERRGRQLEEQLRHALPAKIDAAACGISLVHEDTRASRREHGALLREHSEALARHGEMLEEILRRLPPARSFAAPAG
jgi:hypothetical protein